MTKVTMFLIVLSVMLLISVQKSVLYSNAARITPKFYSEDFTFPMERSDVSTSCTLKDGTAGRCVSGADCPYAREAYQSGINPIICHFEGKDPVVCCSFPVYIPFVTFNTTKRPIEPKKHTGNLITRRESLAKCEEVYSLAAPLASLAAPSASLAEIVPGEFHTSVVGGQVTSEGEFPHMAVLGWTGDNNKIIWRCGGSLISHDFVLTAAHCVVGRTPPDIIRIGEKDLFDTDIFKVPQDFGIESITAYPSYQPGQLYDDIALIKLNKIVTITGRVRPACLWQENAINFTDVIATGYGHIEFGGIASNELLKVDLKLFNNDDCALGYQNDTLLQNGIVDSQLCAGDSTGEKDTCQGDSGGPLQVTTMNGRQLVYHVIGVTSFGKGCATTMPGVYTRVSYYLDWIESTIYT